jgi:hypothetical protein
VYIVRDKKSKTTPHRGIEPGALKEVSIRTLEIQNITENVAEHYLRRAYIGFLMKTGDVTNADVPIWRKV